jgi:hypothetical protein
VKGRQNARSARLAGGPGRLADAGAVTVALAGVRLSIAAADGAGIGIAQDRRGVHAARAADARGAAAPVEKVAELSHSAVRPVQAGQRRGTASSRAEERYLRELSVAIAGKKLAVAPARGHVGHSAGAGHEERVALVRWDMGPANAPNGGNLAMTLRAFAPPVAKAPTARDGHQPRIGDLAQAAVDRQQRRIGDIVQDAVDWQRPRIGGDFAQEAVVVARR